MADLPFIRDTITIDQTIQNIYNSASAAGPVTLVGRIVKHAPGFTLRLAQAPLIIIAESYDGNGGMIDATGAPSAIVGQRGANGVWPGYLPGDRGMPAGPGTPGGQGTGGGPGGPGGTVILRCRQGVNVHIDVRGGAGGFGGPGGNGGRGVDGFVETRGDPENPISTIIDGTPGGDGGRGGPGGPGGSGGVIVVTSMTELVSSQLSSGGGPGGLGGPNGARGMDGRFCPEPEFFPNINETFSTRGDDGAGGFGEPPLENIVNEDGFLQIIQSELGDAFATWMAFRLSMAEYFYRMHNPAVVERADFGRLAAGELEAILRAQPESREALRLHRQLIGFPETIQENGETVWRGGGNNILGLPRDFDLLPRFDQYIHAFNELGALVLTFLTIGTGASLNETGLTALRDFVDVKRTEASAALANTIDDLGLAEVEQRNAAEDLARARKKLEEITAEIQAALPRMRTQELSIGDIIGTVGSVAAAVVSVAGAIPTGGASLVALVPSIVALSNSITNSIEPVAQALFKGTDADLKAVNEAYQKVGKHASAIVGAGRSVVDFVRMVETLGQRATPDNSAHLGLVKRGAELAHEVLIADRRSTLAKQRVEAATARKARAQDVVTAANSLSISLGQDAASVRAAGLLAIEAARSKVDVLLGFAFRAQRSVEIYTLKNHERTLAFDAGTIHPDTKRNYSDGLINGPELVSALTQSWRQLLQPAEMQSDYLAHFENPDLDQDIRRISLTDRATLDRLRSTHSVTIRIEVADLPDDHFEAKTHAIAIAFVGSSSQSGIISCEVGRSGRYEQRLRDGSTHVQILQPRRSTSPAQTQRLVLGEVNFRDDPALEAPTSLAFWGRGVAGEWTLTIPEHEFESDAVVLDGLTELQLWIKYRFTH